MRSLLVSSILFLSVYLCLTIGDVINSHNCDSPTDGGFCGPTIIQQIQQQAQIQGVDVNKCPCSCSSPQSSPENEMLAHPEEPAPVEQPSKVSPDSMEQPTETTYAPPPPDASNTPEQEYPPMEQACPASQTETPQTSPVAQTAPKRAFLKCVCERTMPDKAYL